MPKVTNRCRKRIRPDTLPVVSIAFSAPPPRKVSFEDGQCDADQISSSSSMPLMKPMQQRSRTSSQKLFRPKSSVSLVELLQSNESEACNYGGEIDEMKTSVSTPLSPTEKVSTVDLIEQSPTSLPSSPWGQFVDMTTSPEGDCQYNSVNQVYGKPCNCCTSCRRRGSNPYGVYRRHRQEPPTLSAKTFNLVEDLDWEAPAPSFRLAPRRARGSTDQLVGDLHRLSVD